jgi:hypothetical protein
MVTGSNKVLGNFIEVGFIQATFQEQSHVLLGEEGSHVHVVWNLGQGNLEELSWCCFRWLMGTPLKKSFV